MITKRPFLSVTVVDGSQSYSKMRMSIKNGVQPEQALDGAEALLLPLYGISDCRATRLSVTYGFTNEDAPSPAPGSNASIVAVLVFQTSTEGQFAMIQVPGVAEDCILNDGSVNSGLVLDLEHPSVVSLVNFITSDLFCNIFGHDITELAGTIIERRL